MNWSSEQEAIFNWFATGAGSLVVQARAGTGKTTTITEAFNHAPEARILYAVFNKKNQVEAEGKIKDYRVDVKTLHSVGFSFIKKVWPSSKPDANVEGARIKMAVGLCDDAEGLASLTKLVGFAKNTTIQTTDAQLLSIIQSQDLFAREGNDWLIARAQKVLALSMEKDPQGRISFDDMVWLPVRMDWAKPTYNMVVIDEAQDMNLPQLTMARKSCQPGGRVCVIGDDRQAIYGFRGAVQNGMNMMKVTMRAATLGLTTTYRCPKKVVAIAQTIVPDYTAAPSAPEGEVLSISESSISETAKVGDAILSRLNAPLMPIALQLIRKGISARIEGRDIGKQLMGMVRNMKARSVPDFIARVGTWADKQIQRLEGSKYATTRIEQVQDIAMTLVAVAEGAKSVEEISKKIDNLFQDTDAQSKPAVILSSVHKAKGLEWDRVFLLSHTFRKDKGDEEKNIYYVAVTRAKKCLFMTGAAETPVAQPATAIQTPAQPEVTPAVVQAPPQAANEVRASGSHLPQLDGLSIPHGMVFRRVGDVFLYGKDEYVVEKVTPSRSVCRCLTRGKQTVENKLTGEKAEFSKAAQVISISSCCEPSCVIRRMTEQEVLSKQFPKRSNTGSAEESTSTKTSGDQKESNTMDTKKRKPIAGRAAFVHNLKAKKTPKKEVLEAVQKKFDCSEAAFNKIWDAKAHGASTGAKKAKPAAKAKASKAAPARKAAKKSGPPPRKAAPVAAPVTVAEPVAAAAPAAPAVTA